MPSYASSLAHPLFSRLLRPQLREAVKKAPSLVILDDIDVLCPSAENADPGAPQQSGPSATTADIANIMDILRTPAPEWGWTAAETAVEQEDRTGLADADDSPTSPPGEVRVRPLWAPIVILATASDASTVAPELLRLGRFDKIVELPAPTTSARFAMLQEGLRTRGVESLGEEALAALERVAERADGYNSLDVGTLLDRATLRAARRVGEPIDAADTCGDRAAVPLGAGPLPLTTRDLEEALEGYTPAAFWGAGTERTSAGGPSGWEDVGGARDAREALHEALELPLRYGALLAKAPLRLRTGLLLYGPPGTGKTHIIRAAIAASGVRCINVSGPELLNKYIGASEAAVRDVFARAAAAAPSALFFDEFESLAPARGADSTGVTDRVVNQLLTELDGVGGLEGVTVLAATSRPDLIDPALLRPGRLDRLVRCEFPEADERKDILSALLRKSKVHEDVDIAAIAQATEGFTGADLAALLGEAQLAAVHEQLDRGAGDRSGVGTPSERCVHEPPKVSHRHLEAAVRTARPSVAPAERARLEFIYERFSEGKSAAPSGDSQKRATLA